MPRNIIVPLSQQFSKVTCSVAKVTHYSKLLFYLDDLTYVITEKTWLLLLWLL